MQRQGSPPGRGATLLTYAAIALGAAGSLAGCRTEGTPNPGPAISATPTVRVVRPEEFICDTPQIAALGLGLKEHRTVPEAEDLLRGVMPLPDPATLPEGLIFDKGYFNSQMQGKFKQSTMSLAWLRGNSQDEIDVYYFNAYPPMPNPPQEPHEVVTIRGGTTAYLMEPTFREGMHSITWTDGCRWITVGGDATEEEVLKIAEGLRMPEDTPPDATLALPYVSPTRQVPPTGSGLPMAPITAEPAAAGPTPTE